MLHNRELTYKAKQLRRNMTKEERHLWFDYLKDCPKKFQAQKVIENYIVDFYCAALKLIIELDGDHHKSMEDIENYDKIRDNRLKQLGYRIIRFSNNDINTNFRGVCEYINHVIEEGNQSTPF